MAENEPLGENRHTLVRAVQMCRLARGELRPGPELKPLWRALLLSGSLHRPKNSKPGP